MLTCRPLTAADAADVAHIHAESWRSAYRGILPDHYLDRQIEDERRTFWRSRLAEASDHDHGAIASCDGARIGFAFGTADHSSEWGHLIDNLHVLPAMRGRGSGRLLLRSLVEALARGRKDQRLHLWVYNANRDAIRFYERLGATWRHSEVTETHGDGRASISLYTWAAARELLDTLADMTGRETLDPVR